MWVNNLGEIGAHNKRDKRAYKSNPDIDISKSKNNIDIVPLNERYYKGYYKLVKDYKKEYEEKQKTTREDWRKSFNQMLDDSNSVVADELLFTSDNDFFKSMSKKDKDNVVKDITAYHKLDYYKDSDLHDIADGTSREDEINDYIYEQNYGIDKDYDDRDIDI